MKVNGDYCHDLLIAKTKQKLAYRTGENYAEWKKTIREKFYELTGLNKIKKNAEGHPLNIDIEKEEKKEGYTQIRFTFESEPGAVVPCYLLVPDTGKEKYPVVITLQGHYEGGMYGSIGEIRVESDKEYQPRGAFAVQAVRNGYIALALEQRAMGERKSTEKMRANGQMCSFSALRAFQLGRTLIGERVWDISRAIDCLAVYEKFEKCDLSKIAVTGNSGGGTASFYAGCFDERIGVVAPSCAFCSYKASILDMAHCACNYIPHAYEWFEMQDLSCLIAPRKFVPIAGKEDHIFPYYGVEEGWATVKKIYQEENVEGNCRLVETPKGHFWCEEIVWQAINEAFESETVLH